MSVRDMTTEQLSETFHATCDVQDRALILGELTRRREANSAWFQRFER